MSEEMTSSKAIDTNYIKLAQIYHVLKDDEEDDYHHTEEKIMYIKAIIDDDFDINYKLPSDSFICQRYPHFSGNTVSHFIVELVDDQSYLFEELIKRDIGLTIQNDNGYTPLLLAFIKDMKIDKILYNYIKRKILNNFCCKHGLSHFHVACTTNMTELIDHYLKTGVSVNERVNDNSPNFGGYTPLHFATEYCQPQMIEFLLKNGANLNSKNANGLTPLHLLINKLLRNEISIDDQIQKFFQDAVSNNLFNLPDDVGFTLTHLKSILGTFENKEEITNIDALINLNSPFLPGFTPLHFAGLNFQTVTLLLKAGADILAQDINGTTPLALFFNKFDQNQIIDFLLIEKRHKLSKLKFTNGVEIIEVLKAMQKDDEFESYIKKKFHDINSIIPLDSPIWPGCSLLHLVAIFDGPVHKILACPKINAFKNVNGTSPLYIACMNRAEIVEKILNSLTFTTSYPNVDHCSLSYLHTACATKNIEAVKFLLKNGADPNLPTLCDIQWEGTENCNMIWAGSTPLHIAVHLACSTGNSEFVNVLLDYGAKPNIADASGVTPYYIALWYEQETIFDKMLKSDKEFYSRKEYEKLGLTRLQLACFIDDLSMVKEELASGTDVNKQISFDSKIWPGDTALHILCRKFYSRIYFVQLLLVHRADSFLQNAYNDTPVYISSGEMFHLPTHLLGNNFYSKNPVNNQGISHFHGACISNNLLAVENYLKSGIDVNEAIDYFADTYAGFTPLHLAVWNDSVKLIKLLFNYGADPNIKSSEGYTPLHLAVHSKKYDSLRKLISYSAVDIQAKNGYGDTALEIGIRMNSSIHLFIELLLDKGACSTFSRLTDNRYGKTLIVEAIEKLLSESFKKLISTISEISDDKGNNLIHHIALDNHIDDLIGVDRYIEILVEHGCEFDHKNNEGKTPLHFAVSSGSRTMCHILLNLGADINIKDDDKKTPFSYYSEDVCKFIIIQQLLELESIGFDIDDSNRLDSDAKDFYKNFNDDTYRDNRSYFEQCLAMVPIEKEEFDSWLKAEINPTFSTAYIFSNQFLRDFKSIPESQLQKILKESCRYKDGESCDSVLKYYIKIQFRRAQTWTRLFVPAANSFQALSGLDIPEMCLEIVKHLDIDSMMNLVRVANGKLEFVPLSENDQAIKFEYNAYYF